VGAFNVWSPDPPAKQHLLVAKIVWRRTAGQILHIYDPKAKGHVRIRARHFLSYRTGILILTTVPEPKVKTDKFFVGTVRTKSTCLDDWRSWRPVNDLEGPEDAIWKEGEEDH
jgi:hypothetical protein